MSSNSVLITGATGFVGGYLMGCLPGRLPQYSFIGTSRSPSSEDILRLDLTSKEDFAMAPRLALHAVVHTAACTTSLGDSPKDAKDNLDVNVSGLVNLFGYAQECGASRIVYCSSLSVYGSLDTDIVDEDTPAVPTNYYGMSKLLGERVLETLCRSYGMGFAILRLSSVYGPGQRHKNVLYRFIEQAVEDHRITVYGSGERTQDFVYVDDVATAVSLCLESGRNSVYNIGSGESASMSRLAEAVAGAVEGDRPEIAYVKGPEDTNRFRFSIEKAAKELGYKPAYNLQKGVTEFYKYLKE